MSDYLQRHKALREKFFPSKPNLVQPRLLRRIHPAKIYDEPVGPEKPLPVKLTGFRIRYSRPIGPNRIGAVDLMVNAASSDPVAIDHPGPEWVIRAYERGLVNSRLKGSDTVKAYICKALVECCVDLRTVRGDSRLVEAATARRLISYWLHVFCGLSTPKIGELIIKDHSSVVVAIRRYRELMARAAMEAGQ